MFILWLNFADIFTSIGLFFTVQDIFKVLQDMFLNLKTFRQFRDAYETSLGILKYKFTVLPIYSGFMLFKNHFIDLYRKKFDDVVVFIS